MKEVIAQILKKALAKLNVKLSEAEILKYIEVPPSMEMGDFAFPCFFLASILKEAPHEIAIEIREKISEIPEEFEDINSNGPYVNFFVNRENQIFDTLNEILSKKEKYGKPDIKEKNKIMIEFSQPNTHKAFHVGHIRGTSLGESISRILEFHGNKITRANYSGDTGMHVAKWLWCYTKFHAKEKLTNEESWIAKIYVDAAKKYDLSEKNQKEVEVINWAMEKKENKKLMQLWEKSRKYSIDSWKKIYKELNTKFDVHFFESEVEKRAKDLAYDLRDKKIAVKSDEAIIMNLKKYNLGVWILLRKDGTVLYSAKDIALAEKKFSKFNIDSNITIIGAAQTLHMMQLAKTLELMKSPNANKNSFVPFSEVRLPTGKMSSRTGENILYSDFMKEMIDFSKKQIKKRDAKISKTELEKRALKISVAAIKYSMLKQSANKNIIFSKEDALNFEGDSGPYLLYSYARANSILKKAKNHVEKKSNYTEEIEDEEIKLIKFLAQFPEIVASARKNLNPSQIANYSYKIAQSFNEFYHACPVIDSKNEDFRKKIVQSFIFTMKNSLDLLGIEVLEKM